MTKSNITNTNQLSKTKEFNIHKRIFNFVIRVLKLTKELPKTNQNLIFIGQITRSVTSIGANAQEADGSTSRKEFFRCFTIAKKETKETNYWIRVIAEINPLFKERMQSLIIEGKEIESIVSAIVQKGRG